MNQNFSQLTVHDLEEMLAEIKRMDGVECVTELIEISEGLEAAMSQNGAEEPQDPQRLLRLLGLAWEMERRMKELQSILERMGVGIQSLPVPGSDLSSIGLIHALPDYKHHGICE